MCDRGIEIKVFSEDGTKVLICKFDNAELLRNFIQTFSAIKALLLHDEDRIKEGLEKILKEARKAL